MASRLLLALCVLTVCEACAEHRDDRKNVLLVVVDSVRSDRLSIFGHDRPQPGLEALEKSGTSFTRAYSTASWTKPSVASMLTGLHPTSHGATNAASLLEDSLETLPEIFSAGGYTTAAVVSHHLIGEKFHFQQGFDHWDQENARGHRHISSEEVTLRCAKLLQQAALDEREAPFLLFAHYFDPHYDYRNHGGVDYAAAAAGRLDGSHKIGWLRGMMKDITEEERQFLLDCYDEEISYTDTWIARLLKRLEVLGLTEDTVVAFTVDHGEEFGERGWLGHVRTLYEELMHVPLILSGEGSGSAAEHVFLEVDYLGAEVGISGLETTLKKAVVAGDEKLIRDDQSGEIELYDLAEDPLELEDLADSEPERARELLDVLERHLAAMATGARTAEEATFTEGELQDLRDLGYAGDE
jgi:arylsulfatase A-like enzyme